VTNGFSRRQLEQVFQVALVQPTLQPAKDRFGRRPAREAGEIKLRAVAGWPAAATLGATGKYLNRLFQRSFQVGKEVRANTGIAKGSVSVGSVAVDLAMQIFGSLQGCKVILLGGRRNQRAHGPSLSVAGSATDFRVEPVL
jgi:hypothetical protein